jgi:hypothetical protein
MVSVGGGALERRCERAEHVGEDVNPLFWAANRATKKLNREDDGSLQFDDSCWMKGRINQPKVRLIIGLYLGETVHRAAAIGEDAVESFRPSDFGQKMNIMKFVMALGCRQSSTACDNQPNECGSDGQGMEEDVRPSRNAGEAVFDRYGGRQVGRGDKNI